MRGVGWGVEGSRTIANVCYSPFTASDRMSSRSKTQEVRHPALALVKAGGALRVKMRETVSGIEFTEQGEQGFSG